VLEDELGLRIHPEKTRIVHVIPVGAGPVKSLPGGRDLSFRFLRQVWARLGRRRGQGSTGGRPRSGRRSLTPTPDGACCLRRRKWGGLLLGSMVAGRVRAPVRFPGCGQARLGAVGHPFAARWRHGVLRQCGRSGSIRWGDLARGGGHDVRDPRPTAVVGRSWAGRLQATDMPVT
jgi:hypothetical protein